MNESLPDAAARRLHDQLGLQGQLRLQGPLAVLVLIAAIAVAPAWQVMAGPPPETGGAGETDRANRESNRSLPKSPEEARVRAQLLHEMAHGALQVMHRDFFEEEESHTLPSQSLEDVFAAMKDRWQVELHWLTVNAAPMNVDHNPRDAFEKQAVKALAAGEEEYDAVERDRFRYVGAIRLGSQCLKCHVPKRTSLEDRTAGLVITMPFKSDEPLQND